MLRVEAALLREFALTVTDPEVLAEIHAMIEEWERRAREQTVSVERFEGERTTLHRLRPPPRTASRLS
jgi:hypothetical protein